MLLIGLLLLACCVIAFIFMSLQRGGEEQSPTTLYPTATAQVYQPAATPTLRPTSTRVANQAVQPTSTRTGIQVVQPTAPPASSVKQGQTWTIMLYADADDKVLEQDIFVDLNEAERTGSTDRVRVVAQLDRNRGAYTGDGNWATAKRFLLTRDNDLNTIGSRQIADIGEVNMADPRTLVDFATWAIKSYPADKYVLIMSDHGMGWPGGWSDPEPAVSGDRSVPIGQALGNVLLLNKLDAALNSIVSSTGIGKFEMIGMDACLMSHIEVYSALAPYSYYAVASQETEPSLGWAYTKILQDLTANPDMSGAQLGKAIVASYIQDDQRILDAAARADFLRQTQGMSGMFGAAPQISASQLASQLSRDITLTAVDLTKLPALVKALNDFSVALQDVPQNKIAKARTYAQSFTSVWGSNVPASYLDLGHLVYLIKKEAGSATVTTAADNVLRGLMGMIVAEKHGQTRPGATGVSIYFPNSQLYQSAVAGPQSYTVVANRFSHASLWDDFLKFHYTGSAFRAMTIEMPDAGATLSPGAIPDRGTQITAPGAEKLQVSPVQLSATSVSVGKTVRMSTQVQGANVGYIYIFAGYLDQTGKSIFVADTDYLDSDKTQEMNGVYYPDWGDGRRFTLQFDWEPIVYGISDGKTTAVIPLMPASYGANPEQAVYTVDGIYTFADDGSSLRARLYFSNGVLTNVYTFTGGDEAGAPREVRPITGDKFTVEERWLDIDSSGAALTSATQLGKTLTFGTQNFTWKELDAAAGDYVIGFIVEDLDGNQYDTYQKVTVR